MRLIDADALKEWIDEYVSVFKKSDNKDIKGYIEHQPTIEPKRGEWKIEETESVSYEDAYIWLNDWDEGQQDIEILGCISVSDINVPIFDRKTENSSEKPNNCEHITEDGVTCAKYPACDDCLNNPLNKVKGSERLVKGKDEPQLTPNYCEHETYGQPCEYEPKDEPRTERSE